MSKPRADHVLALTFSDSKGSPAQGPQACGRLAACSSCWQAQVHGACLLELFGAHRLRQLLVGRSKTSVHLRLPASLLLYSRA